MPPPPPPVRSRRARCKVKRLTSQRINTGGARLDASPQRRPIHCVSCAAYTACTYARSTFVCSECSRAQCVQNAHYIKLLVKINRARRLPPPLLLPPPPSPQTSFPCSRYFFGVLHSVRHRRRLTDIMCTCSHTHTFTHIGTQTYICMYVYAHRADHNLVLVYASAAAHPAVRLLYYYYYYYLRQCFSECRSRTKWLLPGRQLGILSGGGVEGRETGREKYRRAPYITSGTHSPSRLRRRRRRIRFFPSFNAFSSSSPSPSYYIHSHSCLFIIIITFFHSYFLYYSMYRVYTRI